MERALPGRSQADAACRAAECNVDEHAMQP